ncbi:Cof-type HAD-IIB family hydrolase [Longirhabdus pacifica]|uniref:Cof-type HAD-IIB family hydrolase n=1 Tax=Longirhabdus pacifica TaxID=2305227 RepID=UPI001009151F|nr:Cof-type HAD-IIB family hydrolase [Longirhabdus pacifica]
MYKMITIDIDDTLLTDSNEVTEGTKQALQAATDQGVVVTLATGRMFASAKKIAKQLDINVPIITYQGALIKNCLDEDTIYERYLPQTVVAFMFQYAKEHDLHIQAYYNDQLYAQEENEKLIQYCRLSNVAYIIEEDMSTLSHLPLSKLIIIDEPEVLDEMKNHLDQQIGQDVHMTKSKPNFLEFVHKEATKGHAVRFLAEHYDCDIAEVIAIGDSWNDHEMIEAAGLGVAMENAVAPLKDVANYVTRSNNEEGVKHVIEKFILKN